MLNSSPGLRSCCCFNLAHKLTVTLSAPGCSNNPASVLQDNGATVEFRIARIKQVAAVKDSSGDYRDWRYLCEVVRVEDGSEVSTRQLRRSCRDYTCPFRQTVMPACIKLGKQLGSKLSVLLELGKSPF